MRKIFHKKLIRDKIPRIIEKNKGRYEIRIMKEKEFKRELKKKLVEEAREIMGTGKSELAKELSDVLELIKSVAKSENISFNIIEKKQKQRRKERGGFKKRIFLIWSDKSAGR